MTHYLLYLLHCTVYLKVKQHGQQQQCIPLSNSGVDGFDHHLPIFLPPLIPSNHHSTLCFFEFSCFRFYMEVRTCIVPNLFHLA
jgi:hypothetical protein